MPDVLRDEALLAVDRLSIAFAAGDGEVAAVRDVSFTIGSGEIVGLVGESGSGKTTIALAILSYLAKGGRISGGQIRFKGQDLAAFAPGARRRLYGRHIAHVAQDPAAALNPALRVGTQLTEGMRYHLGLSEADARRRALALLEEVNLLGGERILDSYPHQLSGGMQQRACIAMALAADAELIVMDEPTTGLDATTEIAIFELLKQLKARRGLSVLFISHNLAAVRGLADRVVILYAGKRMETGTTAAVFSQPRHRYTQMMLESIPVLSGPIQRNEMPWQGARAPETGCPFRDRCDLAVDACKAELAPMAVDAGHDTACVRWGELASPRAAPAGAAATGRARHAEIVLSVKQLAHAYKRRGLARLAAAPRPSIESLDFELRRGEVLSVIGESGSGKTTLARCLVGLERPVGGEIAVATKRGGPVRRVVARAARQIQIVFQNIAGSLHPRKRIRDILARPYILYEGRMPRATELETLAHAFGLRSDLLGRLSTRLSGGERQRAALARAFAPKPSVLVLDEAFSALDVSMKNKVMNLLLAKRQDIDASYLLISHDLPLVRAMTDRVLVLYRGWVCEEGPRGLLEEPPHHPYTEVLLWSALKLEGRAPRFLSLDVATTNTGTTVERGCPFHPRCPRKLGAVCETERPPVRGVDGAHRIACHIPIEDLRRLQRAEWMPHEEAA